MASGFGKEHHQPTRAYPLIPLLECCVRTDHLQPSIARPSMPSRASQCLRKQCTITIVWSDGATAPSSTLVSYESRQKHQQRKTYTPNKTIRATYPQPSVVGKHGLHPPPSRRHYRRNLPMHFQIMHGSIARRPGQRHVLLDWQFGNDPTTRDPCHACTKKRVAVPHKA